MNERQIVEVVLATAAQWAAALNRGDAEGCVSYYTANARMFAQPVAEVHGHEEIRGVWQRFIDDGFSDVEYLSPKVTVHSETNAELSSSWKMNNASGVIHREIWEKQKNGSWLLADDHFEILEQTSGA